LCPWKETDLKINTGHLKIIDKYSSFYFNVKQFKKASARYFIEKKFESRVKKKNPLFREIKQTGCRLITQIHHRKETP